MTTSKHFPKKNQQKDAKLSHLRRSTRPRAVSQSCRVGITAAATAAAVVANAAVVHVVPENSLAAFVSPSRPTTRKQQPSRWQVHTHHNHKNIVSPSPKKKKQPKTLSVSNVENTQSFGAISAASFPSLQYQKEIPVHTLILGTHPSIKSLEHNEYYGHVMNTFWWIVGDCFGFRRGSGVSPSTNKAYKFSSALRHDNVIPYEKQVETICRKGFALWDIVQSCQRPGSLDQDISEDVPNDIPGFCQQHPSIRRIVLSNGASGASFFARHFQKHLESGQFRPANDALSQRTLKKWVKKADEALAGDSALSMSSTAISIVVALPVSPAAARYTYEEKRDFWEEFVYAPGLKDHEREINDEAVNS